MIHKRSRHNDRRNPHKSHDDVSEVIFYDGIFHTDEITDEAEGWNPERATDEIKRNKNGKRNFDDARNDGSECAHDRQKAPHDERWTAVFVVIPLSDFEVPVFEDDALFFLEKILPHSSSK